MRLTQLPVAVVLCSVTVHVPSLWADNTTCANAHYLFPGEVASEVLQASGSGDNFYKTAVVAGRSYSIAAWAPFGDLGNVPPFGPNLVIALKVSTCATDAQGVEIAESEPSPFVSGHGGRRRTIIPTFDGTLWIQLHNPGTAAFTIHVRVVETTLFSPWWFTGGTNQAFVEIRNTTNTTTNYTATFSTSDGTTCGTASAMLPPDGNTAIRVNDLPACSGTSGSAQIAFHGAPGGIVANTTTIDGLQATSFDSPFTPRLGWGSSRR